MRELLRGMRKTMDRVRPPRMTALRQLHEAEDGPFAILIGTILSARTRDENTAKVVRALFERYPDAEALARARVTAVERIVKPIGFYRVKARRIIDVARIVVSEHGGRVPEDIESLTGLPGVGRKTANCVLVYAFGTPAIPVDIHVHRISNRLGLVDTRTPEETEQELMRTVPRRYWLEINDTFVMYGQNICRPVSPMCGECGIRAGCRYWRDRRRDNRRGAGRARGGKKRGDGARLLERRVGGLGRKARR
ncbi:Endonuclease III [Nitrosopumilaceae archaeon]|nr:Endonuclease III [Nitrosopumilaceae archaeon]